MTWLTDAFANAPAWVLIGAGALACGLFLAWCMRNSEQWYIEANQHDYFPFWKEGKR